MIIASVGVHCIVLSTIEAAIVRRPAHPAAASRVLLLGRVGLRAPREDGIDQVADERNLQANDAENHASYNFSFQRQITA